MADPLGTAVTSDVHGDMIGSMRMMTDEVSGAIVAEAVYTAFGELRPGSSNERYGYAGAWGYQTDTPGDLPFMHVGHRYYDPATGRFLQRDPIGVSGGMNVYEYVGSRPATRIDPSGLRTDMGWDKPPGGYPKPPTKPRPPIPEQVNFSIDDMKKQLEATRKEFWVTCMLGNLFSIPAMPLSILIDTVAHPGEPINPLVGGRY